MNRGINVIDSYRPSFSAIIFSLPHVNKQTQVVFRFMCRILVSLGCSLQQLQLMFLSLFLIQDDTLDDFFLLAQSLENGGQFRFQIIFVQSSILLMNCQFAVIIKTGKAIRDNVDFNHNMTGIIIWYLSSNACNTRLCLSVTVGCVVASKQ